MIYPQPNLFVPSKIHSSSSSSCPLFSYHYRLFKGGRSLQQNIIIWAWSFPLWMRILDQFVLWPICWFSWPSMLFSGILSQQSSKASVLFLSCFFTGRTIAWTILNLVSMPTSRHLYIFLKKCMASLDASLTSMVIPTIPVVFQLCNDHSNHLVTSSSIKDSYK